MSSCCRRHHIDWARPRLLEKHSWFCGEAGRIVDNSRWRGRRRRGDKKDELSQWNPDGEFKVMFKVNSALLNVAQEAVEVGHVGPREYVGRGRYVGEEPVC